jgi:UDP-N-acetylmuramoylalanine--D-glutamate ligase
MKKTKKYGIIGLGISGYWAARLVMEKVPGSQVWAFDADEKGETVRQRASDLQARGAKTFLGKYDDGLLRKLETVVVSPGVDTRQEIYQQIQADGVGVISEMELGNSFSQCRKIGVTGTKGKSTTVSMIEKILLDNNINAVSAGNIGYPLSRMVLEKSDADVAVAEVSSFQMHHTENVRFDCAMLIDLSEDHLDRYSGFEEYMNTKLRIFDNQKKGDLAVLYEPVLKRAGKISGKGAVVTVSENGDCPEKNISLRKDGVVYTDAKGNRTVLPLEHFPLRGKHNIKNAVFAMIAAMHFHVEPGKAWGSLLAFKPLHHRLEVFHQWKGILFIDDSKATTPSSAFQAVLSFDEPLYLILGGRGKGADFGVLRDMPAGKIKKIILIGETRGLLKDVLEGRFPVVLADTLKGAIEESLKDAASGDAVLLSPACASFDMFRDYKDRGDTFKKLVKEIAK